MGCLNARLKDRCFTTGILDRQSAGAEDSNKREQEGDKRGEFETLAHLQRGKAWQE
jgi:hypothetical protein